MVGVTAEAVVGACTLQELTYVTGGALPARGTLALEGVALVVTRAPVVTGRLVTLALPWRRRRRRMKHKHKSVISGGERGGWQLQTMCVCACCCMSVCVCVCVCVLICRQPGPRGHS